MSSTKRAVAAIAGGSAGGQLIALACSPLITRFVAPEQYGPFAVVNALLLPLASVVALRLDAAVPLAERDREATDIANVGLALCLTISVLGVVFTVFLGQYIASLFGVSMDYRMLYWIPVISGLMGAFVVMNQLAIRYRLYGAIGRRNLLQSSIAALGQVLFAWLGWGAHGLALGLALGQFAGVASLWWTVRGWAGSRLSPNFSDLTRIVSSHRRYPMLLMPSALLNSLGLQIPILIVAALYGPAVSGWLGMTQRILALPIALIGIAISQVFLGEFTSIKRSGQAGLVRLFLKTSQRLTFVGVPVGVILVVAGPFAFDLVLGGNWRQSGVYARYLAVGMILQMIASPLSQTLIVMDRLRWQLAWDMGRLVLTCGALFAVYEICQFGPDGAVGTLAVTMGISYAAQWFMSWSAVRGVEPSSDDT